MASCPLPCAVARGGSAVHLLCASVAVCFALYLFLTWREMQRLDAKINLITSQMAMLHKTTDTALAEMRAAVEAPPPPTFAAAASSAAIPIPLVIERLLGGQPSARIVVEGGGEDDDDDDEEVDNGDEGDEDEYGADAEEADDRQIKNMLMAHLDGIDEEEVSRDEPAPAPPPPPPHTPDVALPPPAATIPEDQVRAMKVDDLRRALKDRGMDARGAKDVLVARMLEA